MIRNLLFAGVLLLCGMSSMAQTQPVPSSAQAPLSVPSSAPAGSIPQQCRPKIGGLVLTGKPVAPIILSLQIEADGSVQNVAVVQSSGYRTMDDAAAECAATWHYKSVEQNGVPIATQKQVTINWQMRVR